MKHLMLLILLTVVMTGCAGNRVIEQQEEVLRVESKRCMDLPGRTSDPSIAYDCLVDMLDNRIIPALERIGDTYRVQQLSRISRDFKHKSRIWKMCRADEISEAQCKELLR